MTDAGGPTGRVSFAADWTGSELFIWGGTRYGRTLGDGARYAPPPALARIPAALPQSGGGGAATRRSREESEADSLLLLCSDQLLTPIPDDAAICAATR